MNQQNLFPGNRGCGQRERGAAVTVIDPNARTHGNLTVYPSPRCIVVRIDGLVTKSPNGVRFATKGGAFAQAARIRKTRETVRAHILGVLGVGHAAPCRVVVIRRSSGELDRDNAWSACKPVFDGIADAFGLPNDRELQKSGDVKQDKCPPKQGGVIIELYFAT